MQSTVGIRYSDWQVRMHCAARRLAPQPPNMQTLPWIIALAAVALLASMTTLVLVRLGKRPTKPAALPTEWALSPRPVFSTDERRIYRLLREALPHHVVLAKLPMVRFCQPAEPAEVRFWYDLLAGTHVTFAVCSANGRVLAAIDLDTDRSNSRRTLQIKQSVLSACRVRYLRCPVDNLPTVAELQLLVPQNGLASRGPMQGASHPLNQARDNLSNTVANRRAERTALWQDSSMFQDSFFGPDNRVDSLGNSEFASLAQVSQRHNGSGQARHAPAPARAPSVGTTTDDAEDFEPRMRH
jgi:hypothetical protein